MYQTNGMLGYKEFLMQIMQSKETMAKMVPDLNVGG